MSEVIPYQKIIEFEHLQRGVYEDLNYNPTFRASAIFFVWVDDKTNTHVSFMNYWREKNNNRFVSALVTVRDNQGKKQYRDFFVLDDFVYQFNLKNLIGSKIGNYFIGSIEIELFSIHDLKYSFPAIEVFYETPDGVSFVHSNQRVFNNIEDYDRNSSLNSWQTGFDIYANDRYSGYLTLINGTRLVKDASIHLKVFNEKGETLDSKIELGDLLPYSTHFINLKRDIPIISAFLQSKAGFCKVIFDSFGVFTRIACGNLADNSSHLSVTHSYYDCNSINDYFEESTIPDNEYKCFLPFNLIKNIDLDLIFYPIYSPSEIKFSLDIFSEDGYLETSIRNFETLNSTGNTSLCINIRDLLEKHNILSRDTRLYCLYVNTTSGEIPARLTFGMNYRKFELGCNINSSMLLNPAYGLRSKLYLWGPLIWRKSEENHILISHLSKVKNCRDESEFTLKIYSKDSLIFQKLERTLNGTSLNINLETLIAQSGYQPNQNEVLWYTLESSCPNYVCNQIHVSSSGFVGGDHCF
jgi:hypothetical protein